MTTSTSRGVPIAEGTDAADIAARVNAVANVVHDRPGIKTVTTTERNALAGVELWDGRVVVNTTNDKIERYDAGTTSWRAIADAADLVVQTQAQAESDSDNIGRLTTGQRIYQSIAKWAVTLSGSQTITGYKNFTTFPHVNSVRVIVDSDTRLDPLTQAEAESNTSTTPRVATGQRIYQSIAKWAVTLSGSQTVTGYKNFTGGLRADNSPVVVDSDVRLDPLTQAQAESSTDTTPRLATGQRIYQSIAKWAVTLAGSQTVTGSKNFTGGLSSAGSAVLTDADLSGTAGAAPTTSGTVGTSGQAARRDHTHPARVASGTASLTIPGGAQTGAVTVNFPAGTFTGAPRVVAMSYGSADFVMGILGNPTAASVNIIARSIVGNAASGGAPVAFHWVATQL